MTKGRKPFEPLDPEAVHGTEGGRQLRESGILLAGDLPSSKARAKLVLALEYGDDPADVSEYFP